MKTSQESIMIKTLEMNSCSEGTRLMNTKHRFKVRMKSSKCGKMEPLLYKRARSHPD